MRRIFVVAAFTLLAGHALALTPAERIAGRAFPSIFEAWTPVDNLYDHGAETPLAGDPDLTMAKHDFAFIAFRGLGLRTATPHDPLPTAFTAKSLEDARARHDKIMAANPHFVLLASVTYRNVQAENLPEDSPLWLRDDAGRRVPTNADQVGHQYFLDYRKPETQALIAAHCKALIDTGVFDGCMFDWWNEHQANDPVDPDGRFRVQLIARIRKEVGEDAILVGNTNGRKVERTARYLNGMYMEGFGAPGFANWRLAAADLAWGAEHLHKPALTLLEGWPTHTEGRADLARMREVTALALTLSNGYALYGDANNRSRDHAHDWYPFWRASLGEPREPPRRPEGAAPIRREFAQGTALFNPPEGTPAQISFADERVSAATGQRGRKFTLAPADGDLYLKP